ncbi:alpha/beta hydrolase family protein [Paenibacillus sp. GSMTC-2017]|uniref:alpha/beta hydrolase family protein n=1 Tax=Paenibacillus sp. GSMTC-2017 TaxID=2794350 RepID=UPI001E60135E|nr:dienelactone hydrolase [Paenibacillus sp. GSMTC-2017]
MLLATAGFMYAFPIFKLPEPTGPHSIGTQTFHFVDKNRDEIFDEKQNSKRELMVQVWYPAQNGNGKNSPFMPNSNKMLPEDPIAKMFGIPTMFMEYLKYIPSHSYQDSDISTSSPPYPLIILNHGYGSSKTYHTSQAENLASHGYIVASIDHTYSTFATVFPDGKTTTMKTDEDLIGETNYRDVVGSVWTKDVTFTIDQLEKINSGQIPSVLKEKLDLTNIGIFGHSFGGAAAYDSSYDSRIKAGIDLDGSLYRYKDREGITKPFMFIFSEGAFDLYNKARQQYDYTDEELQAMGTTREESAEDVKNVQYQIEHLKKVAKNGGHILYIENTQHYNFADLQFYSPILQSLKITGAINPKRSASIINEYTLDFFNKHLKNKGGGLLEGPNSNYPEMKFASSLFAEDE